MMIGSLDPIDMAEIKTTTPARRKADGGCGVAWTSDYPRFARDANDQCAAATSVTAFNLANVALHDTIITGSHIVLLVDQLRTARPMTFPYRHHLTQAHGYREKICSEHAQMIDAIAQGDAQAAQTLMTMHVNLQGADIINFLRNFDQTFTDFGSFT